MVQNHAEDIARLRRVLPERAIALAMQNRWSEAADVNRKIIELYPNDADAYNRLGKALMEMGRYRDALATYQRAIELDPNNIIAKKNVERLVHLADKAPAIVQTVPDKSAQSQERESERINPSMFIEETGKTGLTTLINLGAPEVLLKLTAGDRVELRIEGNSLRVYDEEGQLIGAIEPKLAKRLSGLMEAGNRYTAAVTTVSDNGGIKIIIERPTSTQLSAASSPSLRKLSLRALTGRTCVKALYATAWTTRTRPVSITTLKTLTAMPRKATRRRSSKRKMSRMKRKRNLLTSPDSYL